MNNEDLKKVGLKVTAPRLKILQILAETAAEPHMSAEDIYKTLQEQNEDVGLATVYRVLTQFEESGLIVRHNFEGGHAVFEVAQEEHHDHLVCIKCGTVKEFVDETIEQRQRTIAKQAGFVMTDHVLNIYGLCSECKE